MFSQRTVHMPSDRTWTSPSQPALTVASRSVVPCLRRAARCLGQRFDDLTPGYCWASGAPKGEAQLVAILDEKVIAEQATARRRLKWELEGLGHVHRSTAPLHGRIGLVAVANHVCAGARGAALWEATLAGAALCEGR